MNKLKNIAAKLRLKEQGVLIGFIAICIIVTIIKPDFLAIGNILNLLRQSSIAGIIAMGMTFVIISGNFDVSVGSIAGVTGMVTMKLMSLNMPMWLAILCGISSAALVGLVNGVMVAKVGIPSLIATMAMVTILKGAILLIGGGYPIPNQNDSFKFLGQGYLWKIPIPIIIFLLIIVLAQFVLTKTRYGTHIYAVGGNPQTSRLSGINVDSHKISVFVISGLLAGLAGIILTSRVSTASPVAGEGLDMDAIASVVIGGTSVLGGEGSALRSVIGVLLMSMISNSFNLLGINTTIQYIFKGVIILVAVGFDSFTKKKLSTI